MPLVAPADTFMDRRNNLASSASFNSFSTAALLSRDVTLRASGPRLMYHAYRSSPDPRLSGWWKMTIALLDPGMLTSTDQSVPSGDL